MASTNGEDEKASILQELPPLLGPLVVVSKPIPSHHDARIRPALSAVHVAAQFLEISDACRFSISCILHRYLLRGGVVEKWNTWMAACLFLGCKASEEPRRLRDVINCSHMIQFDNNDTSDTVTVTWNPEPLLLDDAYWETKEEIVAQEHEILKCLSFDLLIPSPHRAVAIILTKMNYRKDEQLLTSALRLVNQSVFYVSVLTEPVFTLACSAVHVASVRCKVEFQNDWHLDFGVSQSKLTLLEHVYCE